MAKITITITDVETVADFINHITVLGDEIRNQLKVSGLKSDSPLIDDEDPCLCGFNLDDFNCYGGHEVVITEE